MNDFGSILGSILARKIDGSASKKSTTKPHNPRFNYIDLNPIQGSRVPAQQTPVTPIHSLPGSEPRTPFVGMRKRKRRNPPRGVHCCTPVVVKEPDVHRETANISNQDICQASMSKSFEYSVFLDPNLTINPGCTVCRTRPVQTDHLDLSTVARVEARPDMRKSGLTETAFL